MTGQTGDPIREVSKMFAQQIADTKQQASRRTLNRAKVLSVRRARRTKGKSVTIAKKARRVL